MKDLLKLYDVKLTKDEILQIIKYHAKLQRDIETDLLLGESAFGLLKKTKSTNQRIEYYSQFVEENEIQEIFEKLERHNDNGLPF